jgi:5'-phosphate synthase pdxT subunit
LKIGVLALQGAVSEHIQMLSDLGVAASAIRLPSQLNSIDGLVIPGGESTTIGKLLHDYQFTEPLQKLASRGFPLMGTCAGTILLARKATEFPWQTIGAIDIEVKRNAFGRQVDSFEADLSIPVLGNNSYRGIFIRAPIIEKVNPAVDILCQLYDNVVAVQQGTAIACSFHPELTNDSRIHAYFINLITGGAVAQGSS